MKALVALAVLVLTATGALAQSKRYTYTFPAPVAKPVAPSYGTGANPSGTYVAPTLRTDGTYVQGHMRSTPNETKLDNWSTKGNHSPYTGKAGTKNPYAY
jgi:hypothetical protein